MRVVDLTSVVMGPVATQILGDLGADVVSIETRGGDANRHICLGPHPDMSGIALNLMRNKRSMVIDIRDPDGYAVLAHLVERADVFVTNLRPGSRRRARVTYDDLRAVRPELVYCAASGYRPDGPRADEAAYDDTIQSAAGLVDLMSRSTQRSLLFPTIIADKICGMALAQAVLTGLLRRERTGRGSDTLIAMYDVMRAFALLEHGAAAIPEPALGPAGYERVVSSERRPLRLATTEGLVTVLAYERHHFEGLMRIGRRDDMLTDPRFSTRLGRVNHLSELYREYQSIAATMTSQELLDLCAIEGVPAHRVVGIDELVDELPVVSHPDHGDYKLLPSLAASCPGDQRPRLHAPLPGASGREILSELGYTEVEISDLEERDVVGAPPGSVLRSETPSAGATGRVTPIS